MSVTNLSTLRSLLEPYKIVLDSATNKGDVSVEPLERGFGITIGNSLRRVMLSSIEGAAASCISIQDVSHQLTGVDFMREDITEFIENLKNLRFKYQGDAPTLIRLHLQKKGQAYAHNLTMPSSIECINPNTYLCDVTKDTDCEVLILIKKGRGYMNADEADCSMFPNPDFCIKFNNAFSAIKNVSFKVNEIFVSDHGESEKIVFNIETDGSISPDDALKKSAEILCRQFSKICGGIDFANETSDFVEVEDNSDDIELYKSLMKSIDHLELTVRSSNCLVTANIKNVYSLVNRSEESLLSLTNFGRKSLNEVKAVLQKMGLSIDMHIPHSVRNMIEKNSDIMEDDMMIGGE